MEQQRLLRIKVIALVLLTVQVTTAFLVARYSRGIQKEDYMLSTVIFFSELTKLIVASILVYREHPTLRPNQPFLKHYIHVLKRSYVFFPPAFIYFLQNFLVFVSLQNLHAAVFSCINQLKILTTAVFSVAILGRKLSKKKWISLCVLVFGVVCVKLQTGSKNEEDEVTNNFFGFFIAILITIFSGISGVYTELFVKRQSDVFTIWDRNVQLAFYSIFFAGFTPFLTDGRRILEEGIFSGYSFSAFVLIISGAAGGLLVATVIRYLDNIIKCFSVAIAIILNSFFSWLLWDFPITLTFMMGVVLVICAVFLYQDFGTKKNNNNNNNNKPQVVVLDDEKNVNSYFGGGQQQQGGDSKV